MHDGRLHRVTPLRGDAGCSSASSFWAKWEPQSHTRAVLHSLAPACYGCVDQFAQHMMRGCAPTRMPEATTSAAVPMVKELRKRETFRCKHFASTMAQQTVTQPKKTPKHLHIKSIETTNTHTCADCDHRMLPIVKCEIRSRTTCSRFHSLHSESNLACGGGLWSSTRSLRAAHSPLSTRCQKKKTHSLTLILQNHLYHLNILHLVLWHIHVLLSRVHHGKYVHVHPCCRLSPVRALQTTSPATISKISSMNRSTGTSTIFSTMRSDTRSCGITVTHLKDLLHDLRHRNVGHDQVHHAHQCP